MKDQIQQLIAAGQTKDALNLLAKLNGDALLLQAQYNQGEKNFNLGLIDFSEWGRIQARVNFAALEMAGKVNPSPSPTPSPSPAPPATTTPAGQPAPAEQTSAGKSGVFISYNHKDKEFANRIVEFLEKKGIKVSIDANEMAPGQPIEEFIVDQVRKHGFVLSLVSKNSLRSGWVGLESNLALFARLLKETRFIPVMIDDAVFDDNFFFEVAEELSAKIADMDTKIERARKAGLGYGQFENIRERTVEHRQNLSKIIEHFQGVLVVDISGDNFDANMDKVAAAIK